MQIKPTSPRQHAFEQQYNFRVKVNHKNGAVTVHGPTMSTSPSYQPAGIINPNLIQNSLHSKPISIRSLQSPASQSSSSNLSQPIHPHLFAVPINQTPMPIKYSHVYSNNVTMGTSASHSHMPNNQFHNQTMAKTNSDVFYDKKRLTSQTSAGCEYDHSTKDLNNYFRNNANVTQNQDCEIDCVICKKKFTSKQFQYHLELHRNSKKKPQSTQIKETAHPKYIPDIPTSSQQEANPEMLYSFHKSNGNPLINQSVASIASSHNSRKSPMIQFNSVSSKPSASSALKNSQVLQIDQIVPACDVLAELNSQKSKSGASSRNVSINSSAKGGQPQMMPVGSHLLENQSGIRYLGAVPLPQNIQILRIDQAVNSSFSIHQSQKVEGSMPFNRSINKGNAAINQLIPQSNGRVASERSSQILNQSYASSHNNNKSLQNSKIFQAANGILAQNKTINILNSSLQAKQKLEPVNPFALIEHEESKVYEYFPDSQHFSLSQHRVPVSSNLNTEPLVFKNTSMQQRRTQYETGQIVNYDRPLILNKDDDCLSQMSASSISSVRSQNQPLQSMSKQTLMKIHYNKNRGNKINLMNMQGRSQALARESLTSFTPYSVSNTVNPTNQRGMTSYSKVISANNQRMSLQPDDHSIFIQQQPRYHNLDAIAAQQRQVYRGTQVEQDDFRGFESVMSLTKSSKSSAKTKMPRNYLAVDDFIKSTTQSIKK